jgi:hypothetical protein
MAGKIGIGVEAQFDTAGVERQINALGQKIAQANKVQFSPISLKSSAEIEKVVKQFDQLRKIHGDLNKRMQSTGQSGRGMLDLDWSQLYPDSNSRARQMRKVFEYSTGARFMAPPGSSLGENHPQKPTGPSVGGIVHNAAQAGMRAAGPLGGAAANALGTGMSAGFGAGLMGLLGGVLALGVGKLVSGVMEKVEQAEGNSVEMDALKRTLGDVNVSFAALKNVVHGGADGLKITYAEAGKLAMQFTRLGNLSADQYKTISDELGVGVGLSRSYGLDPSAGVGVMGQMRGVGVTSNTTESRRFALLIGETIGKAGAFAKAEEVMEAIGGFASSQTRNNLGVANVGGYSGLLSGMVGSGIPGLDVQGSAALISRINASLSGGGSKGEASQFFTGMVGERMGLSPIQTQMLREGGAFATNDSMFGKDSAAGRFGVKAPGGDKTFLEGTLAMLREKYGHNKELLAQATSNHLGIGINQAMGVLGIQPNNIGEMQKYADLGKLTGNGIGNLSKALYGSADDRSAISSTLLGRSDVSAADKDRLRGAMGTASEREVLAQLTAQYDQERTQGSDIRDSKNALDNIKTSLADKLVPLFTEVRHGIMYLAGAKDGTTPDEIMRKVIGAESAGRIKAIDGNFDPQTQALRGRRVGLMGQIDMLSETRITGSAAYLGKPELQAEARKKRAALEAELATVDTRIAELSREKAVLLERENKRRADEVQRMEKASATQAIDGLNPPGDDNQSAAETGRLGRLGRPPAASVTGGGRSYKSGNGLPDDVRAMLEAQDKRAGLPLGTMASIVMQETGGNAAYLNDPSKYHYGLDGNGRRVAPHTGKISTAFGPFGILESTGSKPGYGVAPLKDKSLEEQARFAADYLAARKRSAGGLREGLSGYGEGERYGNSVMSRIDGYTPLPSGAAASGGRDGRYIFDAPPIDVNIRDSRGQIVGQTSISGRFRRASPFGTEAMA